MKRFDSAEGEIAINICEYSDTYRISGPGRVKRYETFSVDGMLFTATDVDYFWQEDMFIADCEFGKLDDVVAWWKPNLLRAAMVVRSVVNWFSGPAYKIRWDKGEEAYCLFIRVGFMRWKRIGWYSDVMDAQKFVDRVEGWRDV